MTFDWKSFLELAKALKAEADNDVNTKDANLRSAISRAYYSAFNLSKNFLVDVDNDKNINYDGSDHQYVKEKFKDDSNPNRRKIGLNLERLKSSRAIADYKNDFPGLPRATSYSIELANFIVDSLNKL